MSRYQKFVIALLAFLQFTVVLDFMILSPLGAVLMPALHVSPAQFGLLVSAYAFSAAASGLTAAGFADRFDRKRFLVFFYCGFVVGTFLCGIASSYAFLLIARVVTGMFGGVIGSIVATIATDLFPLALRGRVMGFVQTGFAASRILGIPVGLFFSNLYGWHGPFLMIVAVSIVVGVVIVLRLRPIDSHLSTKHPRTSALRHLRATLTSPRYLRAFATTALLTTGGFMLMPFASAFSVHNLGVPFDKLPVIYLVAGVCSLACGPLIGRAADRVGKFKTFALGTSLTIVLVLAYTHLGRTPLPLVILINAVMFVAIASTMIPSQALISAIPAPEERGSFMSIGASIQQVSGGIASVLAGLIVVEGAGGVLVHFERVGYVVVGASLTALALMNRLRREVPEAPRTAK